MYNLISSLKKSTVDYEGARCNEPVMKGHFSMILAHFVWTKQTLYIHSVYVISFEKNF